MGTSNSCKSAAVVGLLSRGRESGLNVQVPADGALSAEQSEHRLNELAGYIRERDREDQQLANVMFIHAIERGRWLTEAKAMVPHGEWGNWLKKNVNYSQSRAQELMNLYRKCGDEQENLFGPPKSQALGNLSVTKALMLIDLPDDELAELMASRDVESMTTREVAAMKKELKESRRQVEQARAEQAAAEEARKKISADMALANERVAGLTAEVEAQTARAQERQEELDRLAAEVAELKSRPVEVAVEADAAAVEAARKEAEAAMRAQLDQAKAAEKKALEEAESAAEAAVRKEGELKQAQAELDGLRARMAQTEKRSAISADADMVLFSELYEQAQILVNRMGGVRLKKLDKDPENAEKLGTAMMALIPVVKEAAGRE